MKIFKLSHALTVRVLYSVAGVATTVALEASEGSGILLLDCGDGALRDLLDVGLKPANITGIIISHGHFDHLGGLHTILGFLRMIGRNNALPVAYPAGCVEAEAFLVLTWDYSGAAIPAGTWIPVTLTLTVSPDIVDIVDFTFNVVFGIEAYFPAE